MTSEGRLAGKTALVTGGSRGIGAEIVRRLASDGADVAFTYNTGKAEADEVAASARGLGRRVLAIQADFADVTAPAAVAGAAISELGRLDILVNNAGVTFWRPVAQMDAESFVGPGSTATGPYADLPADRLAEMGATAFLLGRVGTTADTAALVAFLASDEASFITGQVIYNTGGQYGPIGRAH
jgi:NAD(P)-dependent dehydrogenase (short-subunit alcohol dehydrogenase family)